MKKYKEKVNSYEKLEAIYDYENEINIHKKNRTYYQINTNKSIEEMFEALLTDEGLPSFKYKKREQGKTYQHRFGVSIEILLPNDFNMQYKLDITKDLLRFIIKDEAVQVPVYVTLLEKGKGKYIHFSIFERVYYEDLTPIYKFVTKNIYKNRYTNRICKKSDPDAVILRQKGDILSTRYSHFSNKVEWFYFGKTTKNNFQDFKIELNSLCLQLFEFYGAKIIESFFTRRIDVNSYPMKYRGDIKRINQFLGQLDERVNSLEQGMLVDVTQDIHSNPYYIHLCTYIEQDIQPALRNLICKNKKILHENVTKYLSVNRPILMDRIKATESNIFESFIDM